MVVNRLEIPVTRSPFHSWIPTILCTLFVAGAAPPAWADVKLVTPLPPLPDPTFCSIDRPSEPENKPIPCDLPGLPCGPVAANKIRPGIKPTADLDGDGRADIVLLGRRGGDSGASYSVIYRSTPQGFVLADYHEISYAIGPALPRSVLPIAAGAPIIEDGLDEPLVKGSSTSWRRLRRWNGARFVTLLTYCKNRLFIEAGQKSRAVGQRVIGIDVDKDGTKEVIIQGHDRPRVFRLSKEGQALVEDVSLTDSYRQSLPAQKQALALRAQAASMLSKSTQLPAAVSLLNRARRLAPHELDIALDLADGVLRMRHGAEAIPLLEQAKALDSKRAEPDCLVGRAYEQSGDAGKEQAALESCLKLNPPPAFKQAAELRLVELRSKASPQPATSSPVKAPARP